MAKKRTLDQLLAALAVGEKRAVKELEALAASSESYLWLSDIVNRVHRFPAAMPVVARVAIPQLAGGTPWSELDPALVELCGRDVALLWALASGHAEIRDEADAVFMRGADVAKAQRFLALLHTKPFENERYRGVGLVFLALLAKHGAPIPPKYDDVIYFDYEENVTHQAKRLRLVVGKLPMARRLRALLRGTMKDSGTRRAIFDMFLASAPELAGMALAAAKGEDHLRRIVDDLAGKRHPKIVAAVRRYALPPPPPPPPKIAGPFTFEGLTVVEPGDYRRLTPVRKAQYRAAAGSYVGGGDVKNPRDFIAKLKRDELDESDAEMRTWRVLRDGVHVYDLWVVWVDNGSFFHANTAERAMVQIIQGSFGPYDKKPASAELAKLLGASEPKGGLWSTPKG